MGSSLAGEDVPDTLSLLSEVVELRERLLASQQDLRAAKIESGQMRSDYNDLIEGEPRTFHPQAISYDAFSWLADEQLRAAQDADLDTDALGVGTFANLGDVLGSCFSTPNYKVANLGADAYGVEDIATLGDAEVADLGADASGVEQVADMSADAATALIKGTADDRSANATAAGKGASARADTERASQGANAKSVELRRDPISHKTPPRMGHKSLETVPGQKTSLEMQAKAPDICRAQVAIDGASTQAVHEDPEDWTGAAGAFQGTSSVRNANTDPIYGADDAKLGARDHAPVHSARNGASCLSAARQRVDMISPPSTGQSSAQQSSTGVINLNAAEGALKDNRPSVLAANMVRHAWHQAEKAKQFARQAQFSAKLCAYDCHNSREGYLRASAVNDVQSRYDDQFNMQKSKATTAEQDHKAWRESYENSHREISEPKRVNTVAVFDPPLSGPTEPLKPPPMVGEPHELACVRVESWQLPTQAAMPPISNTVAGFDPPRSDRATPDTLTVMRSAPAERCQGEKTEWEISVPEIICLRADPVSENEQLPNDLATLPELQEALAELSGSRQGAKQIWQLPPIHKGVVCIMMLIISRADGGCAQILETAAHLAAEKCKPPKVYNMRRHQKCKRWSLFSGSDSEPRRQKKSKRWSLFTDSDSGSLSSSDAEEYRKGPAAADADELTILDSGCSGYYFGSDTKYKVSGVRPTNRAIVGIDDEEMTAAHEARVACFDDSLLFDHLACNLISPHAALRDRSDSGMSWLLTDKKVYLLDHHMTKLCEQHSVVDNQVGTVAPNGLYMLNVERFAEVAEQHKVTAEGEHAAAAAAAEYGHYVHLPGVQPGAHAYLTNDYYESLSQGGEHHVGWLAPQQVDQQLQVPTARIVQTAKESPPIEKGCALRDYAPSQVMLLHQRTGHSNLMRLKEEVNSGNTWGTTVTLAQLNLLQHIDCDICRITQPVRKSLPKNSPTQRREKRCTRILGVISADAAGPRRQRSMVYLDRHNHLCGGNKYWCAFEDECTGYRWTEAFESKSLLLDSFTKAEHRMVLDARKSRQAPAPGQADLKVLTYRTDNAGELTGRQAAEYFNKKLCDREFTVPYMSVQNPAETAIKAVQDTARALIADSTLGLSAWEFAVNHACDQMNMKTCARHADKKSRWNAFFGDKVPMPVAQMRTFGACVTIHLPIKKREHGDKQMPSSKGGRGIYRYIGRARGTKGGYLVLDTEFEPHPKVYCVMHVHFDEDMKKIHERARPTRSVKSEQSDTDASAYSELSELSGSSSCSTESKDRRRPLSFTASSSSSSGSSDSGPADRGARRQLFSDSDPSADSDDTEHKDRRRPLSFSAHSGSDASASDEALVRAKRNETVRAVAQRAGVDVHLLIHVNARPKGQPDFAPGDKLLQGTEFNLPDDEDRRQFAEREAAQPSSDEASEGHADDEASTDEALAYEGKQADVSKASAAVRRDRRSAAKLAEEEMNGDGPMGTKRLRKAFKCDAGTARALFWRMKSIDKDVDGAKRSPALSREEAQQEKLEHQLKEAALHAGLPGDFWKHTPKTRLQACQQHISKAARALHAVRDASKGKRKKTLQKLYERGKTMFAEAQSQEYAFLVEKLKHVKKCDVPEPKSIREALAGEYQEFWNEAIAKELQQMEDLEVWHWAKKPVGRSIVDTKWVLKVKGNNEGFIDRFKARLVARGFKGIFGVDYWSTHASVVRKESVRLVIAHAAHHNLSHHTLDISGAFLTSDLDTPVYITVTGDGFETLKPPEPGMVLCLDKSLYGLKQAPRMFYMKFSGDLCSEKFGWVAHNYDPCLFLRSTSPTDYAIIALYVDDCSITHTAGNGNNKTFEKLKRDVSEANYGFSMRDDSDIFLGLRIRKTAPYRYSIDQERYILDAAKAYGFALSSKENTPAPASVCKLGLDKLDCPTTAEGKKEMDALPYRGIIGTLRHAEQWTRPDISCALNVLSTFQANPGMSHWKALGHLFRYVIGTRRYGLHYGKHANKAASDMGHDLSGPLTGFVDADWAGCRDTRLSRTGYVFFSRNGAVAWRSRKQTTNALSTCEAEFMAASEAGCENLFLRYLHRDIESVVHRSSDKTLPRDIAQPTTLCGELCNADIDVYMKHKASSKGNTFTGDETPLHWEMGNHSQDPPHVEDMMPTVLHEDNTGAIHTSRNPTLHKRMKHVDIKVHRIRDFVRSGSAVLYFCSTTRQIGDLFTKNLLKNLFPRFRNCVVQITTTTPLALLAPRWTDDTRTRSNPAFSRSPRGTFEPYHRQSNPQGYRPFSYHIRKDRHRSFNGPRQQGGSVTRRRESEAEANDNWRAANGLQHNGRSRI